MFKIKCTKTQQTLAPKEVLHIIPEAENITYCPKKFPLVSGESLHISP